MAEAASVVDFDRFLDLERAGRQRHEWVAGSVYAMAGGTERHDTMVEALRDRLGPGAVRQGCRRFTGNRLVRTASAAYYPDLVIVCGPAADVYFETDAVLIVEVRSPSTADVDRREKAVAYATLPSATLYLLVDPYDRRIDVGSRSGSGWEWETVGPSGVVLTPYGDLRLDDLYDEVDRLSSVP